MDIKRIYEQIDIYQKAEYQIKVKGDLSKVDALLTNYPISQITSETTDTNHHVCMITIGNINQRQLFSMVNVLLHNHYPIISVACSHIPQKPDADQTNHNNNNNNSSSAAWSA